MHFITLVTISDGSLWPFESRMHWRWPLFERADQDSAVTSPLVVLSQPRSCCNCWSAQTHILRRYRTLIVWYDFYDGRTDGMHYTPTYIIELMAIRNDYAWLIIYLTNWFDTVIDITPHFSWSPLHRTQVSFWSRFWTTSACTGYIYALAFENAEIRIYNFTKVRYRAQRSTHSQPIPPAY
jgi:hypothetical protein